jgi:glutaredoxin
MDNANEAVLYGSDESQESTAMVELLNELGVEFVYRRVNRDPSAMREWEQLDGESVPLLRMGKNSIVRGFDRIKVQQLVGWVGC